MKNVPLIITLALGLIALGATIAVLIHCGCESALAKKKAAEPSRALGGGSGTVTAVAGPDVDHEDVYAEVKNSDLSGASELMMWALRSDGRFKWVELRDKPGSPGMLLVVRHTKPKARP